MHGLLKLVPWAAFERLVDEHDADARVRTLTTKAQFIALLYGQMAGAVSLREIVTALSSHAARLYHLGADEVSRSTLADANRLRPAALFADLFALMTAQAGRGLRRKIGEAVRLIDSSGLRLGGLGSDWARFSAKACGGKLHVIYDPDADRPFYAVVTTAKVNDITAAKAMPIEPGATYVFDLGYYDYGWWAKLDEAGCRIVTRFKKNTPLDVIEENPVAAGSPVLSDRIGFLPLRQARSRRNPFGDAVREIRVLTETGKQLLHPLQRSRRPGRGDRRALQAPLGDRAVLPMDQADAEDQALRRPLGERHAHPDRRRPHRLPALAAGAGRRPARRKPARLRPPRPRQSHA